MRRIYSYGDIFVDTSGFFAAFNQGDRHFTDAQRILARAADERRLLVTSNFVVAETHALLLLRRGYELARQFLERMEVTSIAIVRAEEQDEVAARNIIYRYRDKTFSLTDAISLAIMERLAIGLAFTFDRDFSQYGFEPISAL